MADLLLTLSVDENNPNVGDLYLENGTVRLTATLQETVAQLIRRSLLMFQGEWFLDPTQGVPWFQSILGVKAPLSLVNQILRQAVAQIPGIQSIDTFTLTPQPNRGMQLSFSLTLADGTLLTSSSFAPFVLPGSAS